MGLFVRGLLVFLAIPLIGQKSFAQDAGYIVDPGLGGFNVEDKASGKNLGVLPYTALANDISADPLLTSEFKTKYLDLTSNGNWNNMFKSFLDDHPAFLNQAVKSSVVQSVGSWGSGDLMPFRDKLVGTSDPISAGFKQNDFVNNRDSDKYSSLEAQKKQCLDARLKEGSDPKLSALYDAVATVLSDKRCTGLASSTVVQEGLERGARPSGPSCTIQVPADLESIGFGHVDLQKTNGEKVSLTWESNYIAEMDTNAWLYGSKNHKGFYDQLAENGMCGTVCQWVSQSKKSEDDPNGYIFKVSTGGSCKALVPAGVTGVCSGMVSCAGVKHPALCETSDLYACPPADECYHLGHGGKNPNGFQAPTGTDERQLQLKDSNVGFCSDGNCTAPMKNGQCQSAAGCAADNCANGLPFYAPHISYSRFDGNAGGQGGPGVH